MYFKYINILVNNNSYLLVKMSKGIKNKINIYFDNISGLNNRMIDI